jgi:hypothetical protein
VDKASLVPLLPSQSILAYWQEVQKRRGESSRKTLGRMYMKMESENEGMKTGKERKMRSGVRV